MSQAFETCWRCSKAERVNPVAVVCLELDRGETCIRTKIQKHLARLLDPNWRCPYVQEKQYVSNPLGN